MKTSSGSSPTEKGFDDWSAAVNSDWCILLTPHREFDNFESISTRIDNSNYLYCDIWGHWEKSRYESDNNFFFGRDFIRKSTYDCSEEVDR
jgi:UDP-N-acetyl-D-mannosaminuronic acid dehydrogenase